MRDVERARGPREPSLERARSRREPSTDGLRERGDDTAGRKLGLFALAGTLSVAAIISAGVLSGGTQEEEPSTPDPLVHLALTSSADPKDLKANEGTKADPAELELTRLSFPATLAGDEGPTAATVRDRGITRQAKRVVATDAPAATLAGDETERLQRAARHDPLMAQAMPERSGAIAPAGSDGPITLQVVSFQTRDAAERFVNALRARGHRAFLAQTDLPGRGRSFRVRIGPFTTRREALLYQKSFEETERMHGIVVTGSQH
ncbi:MAG TPA: SPOR domain-containing protein [Polyangiales bacterium]|nr:SPOR domain-containing protein [Polyangiales bacterium]